MQILLADDHPLFREGVRPVLEKLGEGVILIEAHDYPSAFAAMYNHDQIELALLDLCMPGMQGIEGVLQFRAAFPATPVVVLSAAESRLDIEKLLSAGAMGYIPKTAQSETILAALQRVLAGAIYIPDILRLAAGGGRIGALPRQHSPESPLAALTERQHDVLCELAKGLSNKQIADCLRVTEGTVKIHLAAIFRVLKVANRTEAVLIAQRYGLRQRG